MADSIPTVRRERARAQVQARLFGDRIFNTGTFILASLILALLAGLAVALIVDSFPAIRAFGLHFLISTDWDPVNDHYGALPFIYGTFVSSFIALAIAVPLSLGVALCLSEMAPDWLSHRLGFLVDLLAAIPSVVYGLWAVFVMGPWIRDYVEPPLAHIRLAAVLPGAQSCGGHAFGRSNPCDHDHPVHFVGLHRCFRVVPQLSAKRRSRSARPNGRWSRLAVIPYGMTGVIGAIILGLGRALGETIAVAMVIGNSAQHFAVAVQAGGDAGQRHRQ